MLEPDFGFSLRSEAEVVIAFGNKLDCLGPRSPLIRLESSASSHHVGGTDVGVDITHARHKASRVGFG